MSHISVYRRWRPRTFEEIIGQERITRTLQNAIRAGRTSHAYLFAGHRGTGKTTTARILAKALNCERGPAPTPCGTCPRCEAIARGVSMDVIEIDGASNTSVDDVRDLKEKIVLAPTEGRYKVYIIDEVHMLSTSAFNALLKTLEEPPAHAVFVLVTTEPHRIPATVLSRCQRFDFRRVSFREITARLRTIAAHEGIAMDEDALVQIARNADGSVRDAESVLDQLSAYADGRIDRALVITLLGLVDEEVAAAFADATLRRDLAAALRLAQEATDAGKDIRQLLRTLLEHFRDLLVAKICGPGAAEILDAPAEWVERLAARVEGASTTDLLRAVRVLSEAVNDARWSTHPRLSLEVALIRLCRPEMDPTLEGMLARIEQLEASSGRAPVTSPPAAPARSKPTRAPASSMPPAGRPARRDPERAEAAAPMAAPVGDGPAVLVTIEDVRRQWARVLEDVKRRKMLCHALLIDGTPMEVVGETLVVGLRSAYAFHVDNLHRSENREIVEAALARVLGRPLRFRCRLFEPPEVSAAPDASSAPAARSSSTAPDASTAPSSSSAPEATSPAPATEAISLVDRARELFAAQIIDDPSADAGWTPGRP